MRKIVLGEKEYGMEWNLFAQLQMERVLKAAPDCMETQTGQAAVTAWACLHGGTPDFAEDPDWVLKVCGRDARKFKEVCDAVKAEFEEFTRLNEVVSPKKDAAPMDGAE